MFEFFIAKKYLIPKKKQLSVSLIALMSIAVIALVVWLVLIFLSVTEGIERNWLKKLTSLNAPLRITPTQAYHHCYYHLIDTISSNSGYSAKSLEEKHLALQTNPYDPEEDQEIPSFWPKPDLNKDGSLKDLVKEVFNCFDQLKISYPQLVAQEYEVTGALLKLRLIRPNSLHAHVGDDKQSFLTQMTYIASFSENSPFVHSLLIPPSVDDINHLIYLSSLSSDDPTKDTASNTTAAASSVFQKRMQDLLSYLTLEKTRPKTTHFPLSSSYLENNSSFQATVFLHEGEPSHLTLANNSSKSSSSKDLSKYLLHGILKKIDNHLFFYPNSSRTPLEVDHIPLYLEDSLVFDTSIVPSSLTSAQNLRGLKFHLKSSLQNQVIHGISSLNSLEASKISTMQHFNTSPSPTPLWPYFIGAKCYIPYAKDKDQAVILPKNFKDAGVKIGDKGFLSYGVTTANAMQEQRLSVYVAGFYDPGVMAVGTKCLLMHKDVVNDIASSSNSFILDPNMTSGIQVWFDNLDHTKAIATQLTSLFKEKGVDRYFDITSFYEYDFAKDLIQQFQSDKYLFTLIGIIILIVACSNIISFLVLMVNDKKKEIGILQSMGASSKSIALIFALCGAVLGIFGSVIGSIAAFFTMQHIDSLVGLLSLLQGHDAFHESFYGNSLPKILSSQAVLFVVISTPILSVFAGLVPAIKACRLKPAETLRSQ